ncbi:MAG TPA: MFS transporter, partial [Helicobacteraceae bacterium]|nr:MFS transporter [Helicobacteraceae bacterium]
LQAPFSGSVIDRYSPKKIMVMLIIIEILATLLLILVTDISQLWMLFILIFVRMGASSFYFTVEMSLLQRLLSTKKLQLANEIHSIIWSFSYTVGMAISCFVVYLIGVYMAFALDALLFCFALLLLLRIDFNLKPADVTEGFFTMMGESFRYMRNNPIVLHLMLLHAFVGFTAFDALVALMVDHYYAAIIATALALGLMHTFRAIGLVIGPMILGPYMNNKRLLYIFMFQALSVMLWSLTLHNFYFSLLVSIVVGFSTTTMWSYTYTLLQHHTDPAYYGRIVAYNDMFFLLVGAGVSLMTGILYEFGLRLQGIATVFSLGFILAAFYYKWIKSRFTLKDFK